MLAGSFFPVYFVLVKCQQVQIIEWLFSLVVGWYHTYFLEKLVRVSWRKEGWFPVMFNPWPEAMLLSTCALQVDLVSDGEEPPQIPAKDYRLAFKVLSSEGVAGRGTFLQGL